VRGAAHEERPYCSRVCCTTAVKNALALSREYPQARIVVLYREMRTYGFREAAYREARDRGVLFVRYDAAEPPVVTVDDGLSVKAFDKVLGRELALKPDLLVLASPIVARSDRQAISELLRVPLNADGFFLEAHVKLRPVEFASEGLFLCGAAHSPKSVGETISQANAAAARAASILSRKVMPVSAQTAWVDPDKCISCMTCVHVCPYRAPNIGKENKAEIQGAVCMGCGSCTAACPAKAISLHHYLDTQILGAINSLLAGVGGEQRAEAGYLKPWASPSRDGRNKQLWIKNRSYLPFAVITARMPQPTWRVRCVCNIRRRCASCGSPAPEKSRKTISSPRSSRASTA
jgi:heterodisulfide reductase subunit A